MTRFVSSINEAESAKSAVTVLTFVALDFASGMVRAHDGVGEFSFGGNTYYGIGRIGSVSSIIEDLDTIARPIELTISGLDPALVAIARDEVYQGRSVTIYDGRVDSQTYQLLDTPEEVWSGFMNKMPLDIGRKAGRIILKCEHEFRFGASTLLYTNESARVRNSAEAGFEFSKDIQGFKSSWGEKATTFASPIPTGPLLPNWRFNP